MKDMPEFSDRPEAPSLRYELRVNGRLTGEAADWFEDMTLSIDKTSTPSQTVIQGTIRDQAALYGLISRIRDLGLLLLSVNLIEQEKEGDGEIDIDQQN
jgi:hypothetical protein